MLKLNSAYSISRCNIHSNNISTSACNSNSGTSGTSSSTSSSGGVTTTVVAVAVMIVEVGELEEAVVVQ